MTTIGARIAKLTTIYATPACGTCSWWISVASEVCDGEGRCLRPEACPSCGRRVPIVDRVVLAGVDLDLL